MGRRNILFITSDQHRGDSFGFENPVVRTPHIDGLARDGVRFSAAITPNLVCQPARASILTGLLPLTHGVRDNGIDLPPATGEKGFAGTLEAAGYRTSLIGKAHFSTSHTFSPTGTPECRASSANFGPDWHGPYMGFSHVELILEGHNYWDPLRPPQGHHYERWYYADGHGDEKNALYKERLQPYVKAAQTHNSALPPLWHSSSWIGDRTIARLEAMKAEAAPFCIWTSFPDPHGPFDAPHPWCRTVHPDEVRLPEHRAFDLDARPWWHRASLEGDPKISDEYKKFRKYRIPQQTDEQLRHLISNYYGMIALIDHNVGRILNALDELGLAGETLVVFSADHGEWLGDHGLIGKGPMAYEGLLRVGLVARAPGAPASRVVDAPVSTIDLTATFLDYAGVPPASPMHSRSLRRLIEGGEEARDHAYGEWDLGASRLGVDLKLRIVRTRRHKLSYEADSAAGELYDLVDDPHETVNRFDDPAYAAVRRELLDMIAERPKDALEPRLTPVGMA